MYLKGLYIAKVDEEYSLDIGVYKKIQGQINAFKNKLDVIDFIRLKNKDKLIAIRLTLPLRREGDKTVRNRIPKTITYYLSAYGLTTLYSTKL